MKKRMISIFLLAFSAALLAQEQHDLLATDSTWNKEVFQFPLNFAPEIPFEGMEEARFPKRWADTTSAECWSYVFVWDIKRTSAITKRELEDNLARYYNGLMKWQHSTVRMTPAKKAGNVSRFTGEIRTLDAFFSKKEMTLFVTVSSQYCSRQKKAQLVFRLSPRAFEHEIWQKLNGVNLLSPDCSR